MPTVVLADPDAARRASHRFALESGGLTVIGAESLHEALTRVAERAPNAVVLADALCAATPPARLAAALRARPGTADVRLVLMRAVDSTVDPTGSDATVTHPVAAVDLVRAVVG